MKYRKFGRTDWDVSEIGFGAWGIGGSWGPVDDDLSIRTLLTAFESGVNFVDTAQMYGNGHSEEVIGRALRQWTGNHIYTATKVQPVAWPHADESNPDFAGRYPARHLREQCEASLKRLGLEAIDLYQLHGWFPSGVADTEWFYTLTELMQEGKIRAVGVSLRDYRPEEGLGIVEAGLTDSIQVVFNLFEQRPADRLFPLCREQDTGVIARVPFDEGALIGNWSLESYEQFADNDFRRKYFKGERFPRTLEKVEALKATVREVIGDQYASLAEVALRYTLSIPGVSCAIPGIKNLEELRANISVSDGEPLSDELLEALKPHNWPRNYHNPNSGVDPE